MAIAGFGPGRRESAMSASTAPRTRQGRLARTSREALSALGVQFLLGMGANLIGPPSENPDGSRIVAAVVLGLHVLVGIGLVVVGVRALLAARAEGVGRRLALWALVVTVATFLAGVGTMLTGSGWLSFLMAAGFLAGAALYVGTFVLGSRSAAAGRPVP
jgi:hypothetical protein